MQATFTEQVIREIMKDIALREKAVVDSPHGVLGQDFRADFETLIQDDDEASKAIMRQIMRKLEAQ